jgi:restriction endonuclease S subunit
MMAELRQPVWINAEDVPPLPVGWRSLPTAEACIQLKPGKLFDSKTVAESGRIPVLNQSETGFLGYHDEEPGVTASPEAPVVTFANHTCAMRLMKQPFSSIQNIFPKIGKPGVTETIYFYYAALGRVGLSDYKGHHPVFRQAYIPIPPLPIQRRIAGILSAYDELIENSQRRIKILEAMARALYREWFVHFRFPGHESVPRIPSPLGEIPQGWEVRTLGNLADISWGDTSTTKASYVAEGYAAYSASGLDGKLDHYDFDRIGIVLSAIGAQCGKTWLARGQWSCIKNTIRFWSKAEMASTEFLFIATEGQSFWPRRGAAQPFISQGDAECIELVVPDRTTMQRFTDFASDALEQITMLQEQTQNLRRTRDLLLPRLLTGQVELATAKESGQTSAKP